MMGHIRTRADALVAAAKQAVVVGGTAVLVAACGGGGGEGHKPPVVDPGNPDVPTQPTQPDVLAAVDAGSVGKSGAKFRLDGQFDPRVTQYAPSALTGDVICNKIQETDPNDANRALMTELVITPAADGVEAAGTGCTVDGRSDDGMVWQQRNYGVLADTWAPRFVGKDTVTATGTSDAEGYIIVSEKLPVTDADKKPVYNIDPRYLSKYYHYDPQTTKLSWDVNTSNVPNIPVTITDAAGNTSVGHIVMDIKYVAPPDDGNGNGNEPSFCDKFPNAPGCHN